MSHESKCLTLGKKNTGKPNPNPSPNTNTKANPNPNPKHNPNLRRKTAE